MSWRKSVSRRKKLSRIKRSFGTMPGVTLTPQNAEHNGHWMCHAWDEKSRKKKFAYIP